MIILNSASFDSQILKHSIDLLGKSEVSLSVLSSLAQKCGAAKDLHQSKRLHAFLIDRGLHRNLLLANRLLRMYLSCGSFGDVFDCFLGMCERNEVSWNCLITAYARDGKYEQAVCAFWQMQSQGFLPNEYIFASVIMACTNTVAISNGKMIHAQLTESDTQCCIPLLNSITNMYAKCGFLKDARILFDQVLHRNVISWTSMIAAYSHHGCEEGAIVLYIQMFQEGVLPNVVTFASMLGACVLPDWLIEGKKLHACIVGCNCEPEFVLSTAFVNMYGNCGSLNDAHEFFASLHERNAILWTAMIWCCVKQGQPERTPRLYDRMLSEGELPDAATFSGFLEGCVSEQALKRGKHVHASLVVAAMYLDAGTSLALMNMYGRLGDLKEARSIFSKITSHSTLSWTSLIASYVKQGENRGAIQLFTEMQFDGILPNKATFVRVVDACTGDSAVTEGRWVHEFVVEESLESDTVLVFALLLMYCKFEDVSDAQIIFYKMQERSLVAWTAMITACLQCDDDYVVLLLYDRMQQESVIPNRIICTCIISACGSKTFLSIGKRLHTLVAHSDFFQDVVVMTALISMYGKCLSLGDARKVFDQMKVRNSISWNAMLAAYSYCGCGESALIFFEQMYSQGIIPNKVTCLSILDACASQANLSKGKVIYLLAVKSGYDLDVDSGNVVINFYGKCGRPKDAHNVFGQMPVLDIITWNTIIVVWAQHGCANIVFGLLQGMIAKGNPPDKITYVAILYGCGRTGLVDEAVHYFSFLIKTQEITLTPEICHSMISVFMSCGLLEEAANLVETLPVQPTIITWTSLCNSCEVHRDMSRVESTVRHALELDNESVSPYIMLSNTYSTAKNEDCYLSESGCIDEMVCQPK